MANVSRAGTRRIGHAENASNGRSTSGTGLSGLPIMVRPNLMSGRSWSWLSGTFFDRLRQVGSAAWSLSVLSGLIIRFGRCRDGPQVVKLDA